MPQVAVGDSMIQYVDSGGEGPAVILAHGFLLDHTIFEAQAAALTPRWRVIAWDARGHGGTSDSGNPFDYWDLARDLLGLMDALELDSAVLGGVSQGGFLALRAALLAPGRVRGLILSDTEAEACSPQQQEQYRQLFAALASHGPIEELTDPLARQIIGPGEHAEEWKRRWEGRVLPLGNPAECLMGRDDITDRLDEVTCPTLLLWGSEDVSLPLEHMELLRQRLPDATFRIIHGAAHTPPLTHPEVVNDHLHTFLTVVAEGRNVPWQAGIGTASYGS